MERILVTGACGQVGSELVPALAEIYGRDSIIASDVSTNQDCLDGFTKITLDVTDRESIRRAIENYRIDGVFHLAAILSALGERNPSKAFQVNMTGTFNILEESRVGKVDRVVIPSTIGVFGSDTPKNDVPVVTVTRPNTMYGITKVTSELLGDYYFSKFGLDVRGLRYPGLLSYRTEPTAGTTDYAVAIFYSALRGEEYKCFLKKDTSLPMMYMPDAIEALIKLSEADISSLTRHTDYNVSAFSFTPEILYSKIVERIPDFTISYEPDYRQAIADTWPNSLDSSLAERDWGFRPKYDLDLMVSDMIENIGKKVGKH